MDDNLEQPNVQKVAADNNSIAIGEININGTVTGNITIGHTIVQAADARLRRDLGILLKNVETTWIKGVLEKSVHQAALLELGMEIREEAVDNPWRMVMEKPDQSRETLPQGRKIKDIFDEANRLLLILGEPGSGKTTTLLQLARDLIAGVDAAFTQPVPVILNLSTWTNKQQPLDEWLIAELNSKYRLPKKDGKKWLRDRRILPLLDGLDEVKPENRAACVEKINQLVKDYGLQGLVVCSRIKDYADLNVRLAFYRAIYLQPLTPEQVDEYLDQAGEELASLHATLQADNALRSLAQSPLILNVMSLAYQNISAETLINPALATDEARRKELFETYIARMFNRKAGRQEYDNEQTKRRLSWLARNMQRHNQEVFLIEGVQPSWLAARHWQWIYFFASRLVSGLMMGPVIAWEWGRSVWSWPIIGLCLGLPLGLIDVWRFEWLYQRRELRKPSAFWWLVINIVVVGLIVGVILVLIVSPAEELSSVLTGILQDGLILGLIFGARGSKQSTDNDIHTVEALRWSWQRALEGGWIGGIIGGLGGLIYWLINWLTSSGAPLTNTLSGSLILGLISGLIGAPIGAISKGLSSDIIETKSVPNQGIRLSIRNAIFGGLIVWLTFGLSAGLFYGLIQKPVYELNSGLVEILIHELRDLSMLVLLGALWYGGFDIIQHYILRLLLAIQGHIPSNYARFLDYAVDRIFLQKVGGGYRFIHRLLLEHFADMGETTKKV